MTRSRLEHGLDILMLKRGCPRVPDCFIVKAFIDHEQALCDDSRLTLGEVIAKSNIAPLFEEQLTERVEQFDLFNQFVQALRKTIQVVFSRKVEVTSGGSRRPLNEAELRGEIPPPVY